MGLCVAQSALALAGSAKQPAPSHTSPNGITIHQPPRHTAPKTHSSADPFRALSSRAQCAPVRLARGLRTARPPAVKGRRVRVARVRAALTVEGSAGPDEEHKDKMGPALSSGELEEQVEEMNLGRLPFAEGCGVGLVRDIKTRLLPHYVSDFVDGLNSKAFASSLFLSVACLCAAATFGVGASVVTNGQIGCVEMILSTSVCGVVYSLTCGQPVAVTGFGGAHMAFTGVLYGLSQVLGVEFLPFYAWCGIWSSLLLAICTLFSVSNLVNYFTRFTDETFSALSSCIFMYESTKHLTKGLMAANPEPASACLTLIVGVATCVLAIALKGVRNTALFTQPIRERLSEFAPTISIFAATSATLYLCKHLNTSLTTLTLPAGLSTSTGRPWLVDLWALEPSMIALAIVPAVMLTVLLFMDQVITTRLVNTPDNKLKKGYGYHLDLAIICVYTGVCSLFGLPWMTAATVPSLNHAQSLQKRDADGRLTGLLENRVSNALVHLIMGSSLLFLGPTLKMVPQAVFMGLFLYLGISAARENKFLNRALLLVTDPTKYHDQLTDEQRSINPPELVKPSINTYTLVQAACLISLWVVKSMQGVGIVFPMLIALLVAVRIFIIGNVVKLPNSALLALDQCDNPIAEGKVLYARDAGLL